MAPGGTRSAHNTRSASVTTPAAVDTNPATPLETALAFFTKHGYITNNRTPTISDCATILEQLTALKSNDSLRSGAKAMVVILQHIDASDMVNAAVNLMKEMKEEIKSELLEEVNDNIQLGAHEQMSAMRSFWDDSAKEIRDSFSNDIKTLIQEAKAPQKVINANGEYFHQNLETQKAPTTYANVHQLGPAYAYQNADAVLSPVAHDPRNAHYAAIDQTKRLESQLVIMSDPALQFNSLTNLETEDIVAKANAAIEAITEENTTDLPPDIRIVGAKRTRGGAIVLHPNSPEAGSWLRQVDILEKVNGALSTAIMRPVVLEVMVKYVPISVDVNDSGFLRDVERDNGLKQYDIRSARWKKNPENRHENQRVAFLILGFENAEAANSFLDKGRVCIQSVMLMAERPSPSPQRCLKCQRLDTAHIAATCKSPHDVCGICAGKHRTKTCKITNTKEFHCSNCMISGHGAVSGGCPHYQRQISLVCAKNPYTSYLHFPTESPRTWYQASTSAPLTTPLSTTPLPPTANLDEFITVNRSKQRKRRNSPGTPTTPSQSQTERELWEQAMAAPIPPSEPNTSAASINDDNTNKDSISRSVPALSTPSL
jgi:hypothetical protein